MKYEPTWALFQGFVTLFRSYDLDPDPHQGEKADPDPHKKNKDPDLYQIKIRIRIHIKVINRIRIRISATLTRIQFQWILQIKFLLNFQLIPVLAALKQTGSPEPVSIC